MIKSESINVRGQAWKELRYKSILTKTLKASKFLFETIDESYLEKWLPNSRIIVYKVSRTIQIPLWLYEKELMGSSKN